LVFLTVSPSQLTISSSHNHPVTEKTIVTLRCETDEGNPTPVIQWYSGDQRITPNPEDVVNTLGSYNAMKTQSVIQVTVTKEDNEKDVECIPYWGGKLQTALTKTVRLIVYYPAERVTITNVLAQGTATQGQSISLQCSPQNGNPASYTYEWTFTPRYTDSTASIKFGNANTVTMNSIQRIHTGKYTCTSTNSAGSTSGATDIVVQYKPEDISTEKPKNIFIEVNKQVTFVLRVRSFPEPTRYQMKSTKDSVFLVTGSKQEVANDIDVYVISFIVNITHNNMYGNYSAVIGNGINGELNIEVTIKPRGPPARPINFHYTTVTAKSVTLLWTPGQNGGYPQTFNIESRTNVASQFSLKSENILDPGLGETVVYKVVDLEPNTNYQFRVSANNIHNTWSSTFGDVLHVTTLELPTMDGYQTDHTIDGSFVLTLGVIQGLYSKIELLKCPSIDSQNCQVLFNITVERQSVSFQVSDNKVYVLAVYQNDTEVYRGEITISSAPVSSKVVGLAVGFSLLIIINVLLIVFFTLFVKRKNIDCQKFTNDNHRKTYYNTTFTGTAKEHDNTYEAPPGPAYEDVKEYLLDHDQL
jgi:hypothetical protein